MARGPVGLLHLPLFSFFFHSSFSSLPDPQDYPGLVGIRCPLQGFDCAPEESQPLCIPFAAVRDCIADCPDASDEGTTLCDTSITKLNSCGRCVKNPEKECLDRKWKALCEDKSAFHCESNSNCVILDWLNDGIVEMEAMKIRAGMVLSPVVPPRRPRPLRPLIRRTVSLFEDKEKVSETGKEEESPCAIGEFECGSGDCVTAVLVLDGKPDCKDASDENGCEDEEELCPDATAPCSFQADVAAFACGCPSESQRSPKGVCLPKNVPALISSCAEALRVFPRSHGLLPVGLHSALCANRVLCSFTALCDFDFLGGGWTVFLSPESNFERGFDDYRKGFLDHMTGDFWLGLEALLGIVRRVGECDNELVVRMRLARSNSVLLARYSSLNIGPPSDNFRLFLGPLLLEKGFSDVDGMGRFRGCEWEDHWWRGDDGFSAAFHPRPDPLPSGGLFWGDERLLQVELLVRTRGFYATTTPLSSPVPR